MCLRVYVCTFIRTYVCLCIGICTLRYSEPSAAKLSQLLRPRGSEDQEASNSQARTAKEHHPHRVYAAANVLSL